MCEAVVPFQCICCFDLLNFFYKGTPALFLIQLPFHNNLLKCCVTDERYVVMVVYNELPIELVEVFPNFS